MGTLFITYSLKNKEIIMATINKKVEAAAKRLREAAQKGIACEPVRNLIGTTDLAKAYAVQKLIPHFA